MVILKEITSDEAETITQETKTLIEQHGQEYESSQEQISPEDDTATEQPSSSETATAQEEASQEDETATANEQPAQQVKATSKPTKPRKKSQAFNMPRTAAIKSLIKRNAADSPLLRLPREVRNRIWMYLVGGRMLHIERQACDFHESMTHIPFPGCESMKWVTTCCVTPFTEEEIFQESKHPSYNPFVRAHHLCSQMADSLRIYEHDVPNLPKLMLQRRLEQVKDHMLPVQVLRVFRHIYIEATPILWSTNTMSFKRPNDCSVWMADRLAAQKALLTGLHFDLVANRNAFEVQRSVGVDSIVKSLVGLRSLHLCIPDIGGYGLGNAATRVHDWKLFTKDVFRRSKLANYKQLPLENVTVMFSQIPGGVVREDWRRVEQVKFAEDVRRMLLA